MQITELLDYTEDELYNLIGKSFDKWSFGKEDPKDHKNTGKFWFEMFKERIANVVCSDKIKTKLNTLENDNMKLTLYLIEILSIINLGVPTAHAAALVAKIGYKKLCNC